jgi:hypothetical protein
MNNVSKIKTLYAYEDGDTITPRMGVSIAAGHGLQQFYDSQTRVVNNTDFSLFNPTLFPQPYSGRAGAVVEPDSGYQWYLNSISDNMGILNEYGGVKAAYADMFTVTSVTMNQKHFPALVITDNLVKPSNSITTDIHIYFVGTYGGKQFVCEQVIPVQQVVGNAYQLLVSVEGANGTGDEVLSDDQDWIRYTASLQMMSSGTPIAEAVITFEHLGDNGWEAVTNQTGITEVDSQAHTLKLYEAAVDGSEQYRAKADYLGKTYYHVMNPTDEHDPYYIVDGCSINGDTVKKGETVTFSQKVYKRHNGPSEEDEDVTVSECWTFTYTLVSQRTGNTITAINQTGITYEKLVEYGGIAVRIQASRT